MENKTTKMVQAVLEKAASGAKLTASVETFSSYGSNGVKQLPVKRVTPTGTVVLENGDRYRWDARYCGGTYQLEGGGVYKARYLRSVEVA